MPGDEFKLKIISTGSNPKQGIGYLPEGTMVVVDNTANKIGKEVNVTFEKYIQTNSGRMMFAKLKRTIAKTKASTTQSNRRQTRTRARGSHR